MALELRPNCELLRQGPAAGIGASADLHLRVHLLRRLRRARAPRRLSQLRRRLRAAAHPAVDGMAPGPLAGRAPGVGRARAPVLLARGHRGALGPAQGRPAGGAVVDAQVLLERTDQLSALADALDAVLAARAGAVVFVGGEAGAGKTVLLRAFCDGRRDSARILWGACEGLLTPGPLGPLFDVAEVTGGELEELVSREARPHEVTGALIRELGGGAPNRPRPRGPPLGRRGDARRAAPAGAQGGGRAHARPRQLPRRRARSRPPAHARARGAGHVARRQAPHDPAALRAGRRRAGRCARDRCGRASPPDQRQPVLRHRGARRGHGRDPAHRARRGARPPRAALGAGARAARGDRDRDAAGRGLAARGARGRRARPPGGVPGVGHRRRPARRRRLPSRARPARRRGGAGAPPPGRAASRGHRGARGAAGRRRGCGPHRPSRRRRGRRGGGPALRARRRPRAPRRSGPTAKPRRSTRGRCATPRRCRARSRPSCSSAGPTRGTSSASSTRRSPRRSAPWRCAARCADPLSEGDCLRSLSRLYRFVGRTEKAAEVGLQAVARLEGLPGGRELALAYANLGHLYTTAEDAPQATAWSAKALALGEQLDDAQVARIRAHQHRRGRGLHRRAAGAGAARAQPGARPARRAGGAGRARLSQPRVVAAARAPL